MRRIFQQVVLVGILAFGLNFSAAQNAPADLKKAVAAPGTALVDVRTPEEFREGTADGAQNIPLAELEKNIEFFKKQRQTVVFCKSGKRAAKAIEILSKNGVTNVLNGMSWQNVSEIQKHKNMNILENVEFSTDKANVFLINKSNKVKQFAVALGEGAVMKKHKTPVPATLIVLKGEINFVFADRELVLKQFDTFQIPVGEEHEVVGVLAQNLFVVTQEF